MCGICGFYGKKDRQLLETMARVLSHRGPDDEGFYEDEFVSLGHRRLSIIDLSERGKEPMQNEDGSIQLVFNGEIYNFGEIRKTLEAKGHKFISNTDSEVIVHAYEEFGEDFVNHFNGMFAFALWDRKKRKLLLARDRIGIKPLCYTNTKNRFLFASEIKAILKDSKVDTKINDEGFDAFMAFQCIPDNFTIFNSINKLPPAHMLILENGHMTLKKYWELKRDEIFNPKDYVERIKDLLTDSVRLRLISDVPLGVLLSGGLDSSILVSLASGLRTERLETFTVGFGEADDEFPHARIVSQKFNTNHHEFIIKPKALERSLDKIVWHMDEPLADGGAIATYLVSEVVKSYVKVILVGEGSDEIFGGYSWHKLSCLPLGLMPYQLKKKLYFYFTTFYRRKDRKVFGNFSATLDNLLERSRKSNFFQKMSYFEIKNILPNSLLMKVDKMTMAHSIEARVPFLDHRIVEYMHNLSFVLSPEKIVGKKITKEGFKGTLPNITLRRRKHGFVVPMKKWLLTDMKDLTRDTLLSSRTFFPGEITKKEIERLFSEEKHPLKSIENTAKLWRLFIFQLWSKNFLKNG